MCPIKTYLIEEVVYLVLGVVLCSVRRGPANLDLEGALLIGGGRGGLAGVKATRGCNSWRLAKIRVARIARTAAESLSLVCRSQIRYSDATANKASQKQSATQNFYNISSTDRDQIAHKGEWGCLATARRTSGSSQALTGRTKTLPLSARGARLGDSATPT